MPDQWMTYADAAAKLGIKIASVKRQARSKAWPRRTMNDGTVQVSIPEDRLSAIPTDHPPPERGADQWADEMAALSARAAAAEMRADMAERRATEIASDRDAWRAQAERLASERQSDLIIRPSLLERLLDRLGRRS